MQIFPPLEHTPAGLISKVGDLGWLLKLGKFYEAHQTCRTLSSRLASHSLGSALTVVLNTILFLAEHSASLESVSDLWAHSLVLMERHTKASDPEDVDFFIRSLIKGLFAGNRCVCPDVSLGLALLEIARFDSTVSAYIMVHYLGKAAYVCSAAFLPYCDDAGLERFLAVLLEVCKDPKIAEELYLVTMVHLLLEKRNDFIDRINSSFSLLDTVVDGEAGPGAKISSTSDQVNFAWLAVAAVRRQHWAAYQHLKKMYPGLAATHQKRLLAVEKKYEIPKEIKPYMKMIGSILQRGLETKQQSQFQCDLD